jgi:hypothetical protein
MTPIKKLMLLAILVLLVSGLGYTWITSHVDDSGQVETVAPSHTPVAVTAPRENQPADTTAATNQVTELPTEASRPVQLVGRIVNFEGKGLAGINVHLRTLRGTDREFLIRQAMTDAKGKFVLDDLVPHVTYMLFTEAVAKYPGYRLDGFILESLPAPFEIQLSRLDLTNLEGTVVDTEHAPVVNFTLTIDNLDFNYPSRTITSDASGYFRLEAFPAGLLKIYTAAQDYFRIQGLRTRTEEYRNLTLVIDRGQYSLVGRIHDERGLPIALARVTLNSVIVGNEYHSQASRTRLTNTLGDFEFTGLGGIAHILRVYANGYRPHIENHEFQSFSDHLDINLRR